MVKLEQDMVQAKDQFNHERSKLSQQTVSACIYIIMYMYITLYTFLEYGNKVYCRCSVLY